MSSSNRLRLLLGCLTALAVVLPGSLAFACHTPDRALILGKKYPGENFVEQMHDAHMNQPKIPYAFKGVTTCESGMADIFPCSGVDLVGFLDISEIGGGTGSDSWGWKHEASDRYFALVGRSTGTAFVEITDPANPVYLGDLPSETGSSVWRDIKTYQDHAFIVSDFNGNHGMQVFDLTHLLTVSSPPQTFTEDALYTGSTLFPLTSAHNIAINEQSGHAYVVGGSSGNPCSGLHIVDISNPLTPIFQSCFNDDGYTHDAQCLTYNGPDSDYSGKPLCFASNEDTVTVVNVSDPAKPTQIQRFAYEGAQYTHQGWLTEDHRYFVIDDELDERALGNGNVNTRTYVVDFNDIDNPTFNGFHEAGGPAIDHNQYIVDGRTYQANYNRGLRILELGDLSTASMTEVGFFDTFPSGDSSESFAGAWNVYPFFDNGLILISDVNRGVFVLRTSFILGDDLFEDGFESN